VVLKLNGTHLLLAYVDDVNLLGDNIETIKKKTRTLIDTSKVGLEENVKKTEYMLLYSHQNAGQYRDIKIANRSYENMSQSRYLGMTIKQTPWPLVRERTIPTERPPLVDEI
jgi:hypothetical protein